MSRATAARLCELASEYADEAITTLVEVMRDRESRQRVAAVSLLTELMTLGELAAAKGGGATKVIVLQSSDVARLEEMQRKANEQRAVEAKVFR